jgi:LEA14-like dessication related protein
MSKILKFFSIVMISVVVSSCAQMANYYISNISVYIEDIKIKDKISFNNIDMNITLQIRNDNVVPVYITGLTYNAVVGKSIVASGKNPDNNSFKVDAKGVNTLPIELNINPKKAGQEFIKSYLNNEAEFRVYGTIYVTTELGTFPFDYSKTHRLGAKPE